MYNKTMQKIYPRQIWQEIKPFLTSPQAIVITGIRRSGKTTLLQFIFKQIQSENKLMLDLENPLNRQLFEVEQYELIKNNFERQGLDLNSKAYIFLDEIQFAPTLPSVVKYFIDHYQAKFFLTGSASFYLKNLFSESLAGRKYVFDLYPLSFSEFLVFKEANLTLPKPGDQIDQFTWKLFEPFWYEYLEFGGFPEVVKVKNQQEKEKLLDEIFTAYFQMEIEQLSDYRKTDVLRNLIVILAENTGNLLNRERISKELGISRLTLNEWLSFLQATYLVDLLPPFAHRKHIAIRKRPKVYFVDWGLAQKISNISLGQRLENCVFHLLRLSAKDKLSFYRKKSGNEIDFIRNQKEGFEVKLKATSSDEKQLKRLADEIKLEKASLVTGRYSNLSSAIPGFVV